MAVEYLEVGWKKTRDTQSHGTSERRTGGGQLWLCCGKRPNTVQKFHYCPRKKCRPLAFTALHQLLLILCFPYFLNLFFCFPKPDFLCFSHLQFQCSAFHVFLKNICWGDSHFTIRKYYQTIMLYTLKLQNVICRLFPINLETNILNSQNKQINKQTKSTSRSLPTDENFLFVRSAAQDKTPFIC